MKEHLTKLIKQQNNTSDDILNYAQAYSILIHTGGFKDSSDESAKDVIIKNLKLNRHDLTTQIAELQKQLDKHTNVGVIAPTSVLLADQVAIHSECSPKTTTIPTKATAEVLDFVADLEDYDKAQDSKLTTIGRNITNMLASRTSNHQKVSAQLKASTISTKLGCSTVTVISYVRLHLTDKYTLMTGASIPESAKHSTGSIKGKPFYIVPNRLLLGVSNG